MVKAPQGCQACVSDKVQCSGRTPCSRCKDLNIPCARRPRVFKFRDEVPTLKQRYQTAPSPPKSSSVIVPVQSGEVVKYSSRSFFAEFKDISLPLDEYVTPALSARAISAQQTQVFTNYVLASFPVYFRLTETRVPVNWIEYVDRRRGAMDKSFDWAIRACTAAYTGFLHNDDRFLHASQVIYLRGLRSLAGLLANESIAKADETLAAAIALAVFEKGSCTTPDAWVRHAAGIRTLLRHRGPRAHFTGFGRAMYIVYRAFFVTAALVEGEACFLEEPEWQKLNEEIAAEYAKQPNSSHYTDVAERGFSEIVKIPGLLKRTQELQCLSATQIAKQRASLLRNVLATRAALRGIYTEFGVAISMRRAGQDGPKGGSFVGPVHYVFDQYSTHWSRGVRQALQTLNYMVLILDPKQRPLITKENLVLQSALVQGQSCREPDQDSSLNLTSYLPPTPPASPGKPAIIVRSLITPETRQPPTTDWMDRILMTMGLDAVQVHLIE